MTHAAVFKGTIGALRTIGGRKVIAVTVEVPIEEQSTVAKIAEHGAWVAVARISEDKEQSEQKDRRRWNELSVAERAGIRCNEKAFWEYLSFVGQKETVATDAEGAAADLRIHFNVKSRKDIPAAAWDRFDNEYLLWTRAAS
jgi:hypothetical protein